MDEIMDMKKKNNIYKIISMEKELDNIIIMMRNGDELFQICRPKNRDMGLCLWYLIKKRFIFQKRDSIVAYSDHVIWL